MATLEEFVTEVTAEVEAQKPMMMNVNGKEEEMSDDDYDWYINVNAQAKFDEQENGENPYNYKMKDLVKLIDYLANPNVFKKNKGIILHLVDDIKYFGIMIIQNMLIM